LQLPRMQNKKPVGLASHGRTHFSWERRRRMLFTIHLA
jgi:hypothetical protein